jgi:hypothetical protein
MTITAELADGRRLEFPDETDPQVIQATVKRILGQQEAPPASEPSISDQLGRQAGLTGRYVLEGLGSIPGIFANPITATGNLAKRGLNAALGTSFEPSKLPTQALSDLLTRAGMPSPQSPTENVMGDISRSMAGAAGGVGLGGLLARAGPEMAARLGGILSAQPAMQAGAAATGAGAGGITRESGGGPGAQMTAGLLGSFAPAAAQGGIPAATRGFFRGGESGRQDYANRLRTFEQAGTTPTVGMASGNRPTQQVESALAQVSASAGIIDRAAERIANEMGAKVEALASGLAPGASATKAGLTIERGIGGFVDRFRQEQGRLYGQLDQHMPPNTPVPVANVVAKLDEMTAPIAGAENVSAKLQSPAITAIRDALTKDIQGGTYPQSYTLGAGASIPYRAIKEMRTMIGEKISNPSLVSDIPTAQWRQLYGALSDDMGAAAAQAGPAAKYAFDRANWFTKAGHQRIEEVLNRVAGKDTAEKIFQAAVNPSEMRQGGTTVAGVMKSLLPDERKAVTAAVVRRMGIANPGQQNELGEQFSSSTFLTNWNKVSPEAKSVLFSDGGLRRSLDQVAEASDMIRQGSKVFANPSGTAPALSSQLTRFTMAGALLTGHPYIAATVFGMLTGANWSARLLTKPEFVRWLANTTKTPRSTAPAMLNAITRQAQDWPDEDRADLYQTLSGTGSPATR